MSKELEQLFENHTPVVIYPKGLSHREILRTIAEGFVYPEGVFFFDIGWNNPDGGTGSDHIVRGEVEGPFAPDKARIVQGVKRSWKVGKAVIYEITEDFRDGDVDWFDEAMFIKRFAETNKDKTIPDRKRAQQIADRHMEEIRKEVTM